MNNSDIVVLLDSHTRDAVQRISYDSLNQHCIVITSLNELTVANLNSTLICFGTAIPTAFDLETLTRYKDDLSLKCYLVTNNASFEKCYNTVADVVLLEHTVIEWNLIYSIVNSDFAALSVYRQMPGVVKTFKELLPDLPKSISDTVESLYLSYLFLSEKFGDQVAQSSNLVNTINLYKSVASRATRTLERMDEEYKLLQSKCHTLEAALAKDGNATFSGVYLDRPKILYIKSISHLAGIDILLSVLYSSIIKQYYSSCKIVKIVDHTNARDLKYVPNNYFFVSDTYTTGDILSNDFIIALSGTSRLMDLLLLNRSGLDYLIIHDMRGLSDSILDDSLIDVKDKSDFLWDFSEVSKYSGTNSLKLLNHPTIVNLLDRLI